MNLSIAAADKLFKLGPSRFKWFSNQSAYADLDCAWIRGTDKAAEVQPTDFSLYIEAVEQLLEGNLVVRVLIQTDQERDARFVHALLR